MSLSKAKLIEMYRKMVTIRAFEYKIKELFSNGTIVGDLHLSIGQEAVAVGVCAALRKDDYIVSNHRGHGHCIAWGVDIKRMMAELFGRETGICRGKGGSMHIADFNINMLGASGIVGANMPLAVGAGLAIKLRETDQVVTVFFGDGASNQGTFHESINLAAIWKLPVIFVCENNQYAESTPFSKAMLVKNIADRAKAYGIHGEVVDGMDVMAVYEAISKNVTRPREGNGPVLMECKTYRYMGHEEGDPWWMYRTKREVEEWKKRDPVISFKTRLIKEEVLTENDAKKMNQEAEKLIEEAVKFAKESPWPKPGEATKDVFVSPYY